MKHIFRNNGLSFAMTSLFLIFIILQFITGRMDLNEQLQRNNRPSVSNIEYLTSGHFLEATFENWESEFFQMSLYVILTAFLYQRGSSESNKLPDEKNSSLEKEITKLKELQKQELQKKYGAPKALLKGGIWKHLYHYSLSIVLMILFVLSWLLHGIGGWENENLERSFYGEQSQTLSEFLLSSKFWFQTMQNWQSEFASVAFLVILSIYLRQRGSSQSKEVDAPHQATKG